MKIKGFNANRATWATKAILRYKINNIYIYIYNTQKSF